MKTLLTITGFIFLSNWAFAQILPIDMVKESVKAEMDEHGHSTGFELPVVPYPVMHHLEDIDKYIHFPPAQVPDTSYAHPTSYSDDIIICNFPLEPLMVMHNLEKYGSSKVLNTKWNEGEILKLDSSVSETTKILYFYNQEDFLTEKVLYLKDSNHSWVAQTKVKYTKENNSLQKLFLKYNPGLASWKPVLKQDYLFGDSNQITQFNSYLWKPIIASWQAQVQAAYLYDAYGNNTEVTVKQWEGMTFNTTYKMTVAYSDQNILLESIEQFHNSELNELVNGRKIVNTISAEGHIENTLTAFWNNENQTWTNQALSSFDYNNQGLIYAIEHSLWNPEYSAFVRETRVEYFYNDDGKKTTEMNFSWVEAFDDWVGLEKQELFYDGDGNQHTLDYFYWNDNISNWSPLFKVERIHDTSIPSSNIVLPNDFIATTSMLQQENSYSYNQGNYDLAQSTEFFYSPISIVSGFDENPESARVSIYPNPCKEFIHVGVDHQATYSFELYDITGKQVMQIVETNIGQINTSHLESGIYIYRIRSNGQELTGKVIKE